MIIQFTLAEREEIERNKKVGENKLCGTHITEKISQAVFFLLLTICGKESLSNAADLQLLHGY